MYDYLIMQYLKTLSKEDIIAFAEKQNIAISEQEAQVLLNTLKTHWSTLYHGDATYVLKDLKNNLSPTVYQKTLELYQLAKEKINLQ